jgi:nucleotide-binding universal stress UspA family protein
MFRRVVVPLDGSPLSEAILPCVRALANGSPLEVELVAVATPPHDLGLRERGGPYVGQLPGAEAERLREYLQTMAARLTDAGLHVRTHVFIGEPAAEIVRHAQAVGADLIAMSTHGRTGLARLLHGSVAAAVLRDAGRPLLLLRPSAEAFAAQQGAAGSAAAPAHGGDAPAPAN